MAAGKIKLPVSVSILILSGIILLSLHLMSSATQESSHLSEMYSSLLLINALGSVLLLALVGANIHSLVRQLKKRKAGSRLTARMVFLFVLLSLAPATIVFYYSMQFLHQSIDSWFDVQVDRAMEDALELSRAALDQRMSGLLRQTSQMAETLEKESDTMMALRLGDLRDVAGATELTLLSKQGRIIASSTASLGVIVPSLPDDSMLLRLKQAGSYVGLDPVQEEGMQIRAVVPMADGRRYLQALFPVPLRISHLAESVESAYVRYKEMSYLRNSLKLSFSLTLSLVLLLSLLAAIWVAFVSIRRIVAPVRDLVHGTKAVAAGDYEQSLPVTSRDELGFLVESFNEMTRKIAEARDAAHASNLEVENQRAYLETILANLTSGVMSFDADLNLRTANQAADQILHTDLGGCAGKPLAALVQGRSDLLGLTGLLQEKLERAQSVWQEEMVFLGSKGRQELLCRGTPLFSADGARSGGIVVFDDVTNLMQAQRNAAWGEVARRLAHEIKNPLTPIQLSAERLLMKLRHKLETKEADVLERSTHTIVQQVEAMKKMVDEFSEYARSPLMQAEHLDLAALIDEVLALYQSQSGVCFRTDLDDRIAGVKADPVRIRQVLHNLIKNAMEAIGSDGTIMISTHGVFSSGTRFVEIRVRDTGPGIDLSQLDKIFEPYVTSKEKGTGLGLAIVKKIVEEHGGAIWVDTTYQSGAGFVIRLPMATIGAESLELRSEANNGRI